MKVFHVAAFDDVKLHNKMTDIRKFPVVPFCIQWGCFVRILCPDTTRILLYAQQHIQQLKDSQAD